MSKIISPLIILSILLWTEIGSYLAMRAFFVDSKTKLKRFKWIWWTITIGIYALFFGSRFIDSNYTRNILVNVYFMLMVPKVIISLVFGIASIIKGIKLISRKKHEPLYPDATQMGRRNFTSKLALGMAAIPLGTMLYGILKTAYDFKIHRPRIKFNNLPAAFNGFKIVQLSDIHTGSLQNEHQLQKAIDLVMEEKPDLIVFTGDLVNNRTDEAFPFIPILSQLSAPYGVYSVLGNHDYGDYEKWNSEADKVKNMEQMHELHKQLGWKLMLNEHVSLEKGGEKIALLGVENWGKSAYFPKYGKLKDALEGTEDFDFKILLSHDPSHYDAEVLNTLPDIDLTLAGHTHGFQFGIEIPGYVKWSPSQYIYPKWAGLYSSGDQYLYVNRGLGCLGYMGRVGIRPEITSIVLEK
jgi:predicted MPP superfamily phosphohydrolase